MRIRDATVDDLPAIVQLLADEDGVLVGTLQLSFLPHLTFRGGWRAQVEAVRTANDRRGEGLGSQLLRWAIAAADERGCHLIQLTTNATRPDAQRFYAELAFEATHQGMKRHLEGDVTGRWSGRSPLPGRSAPSRGRSTPRPRS